MPDGAYRISWAFNLAGDWHETSGRTVELNSTTEVSHDARCGAAHRSGTSIGDAVADVATGATVEVEEELKVAPLDQVVAHLEVEVEVRRAPRLREARLEMALVANAFRQEGRVRQLSCTCPSYNQLDKD